MYQNLNRRGVRTSTTIDPRLVLEDIDLKIRTLSPEATPLQTLGEYLGRGPKPKSHRIMVIQEYGFDHYDYATNVVLGQDNTAAGGPNELRYASFTVLQASRPGARSQVYYGVQEKFYIVSTGDVVEVVMTPDASIQIGPNSQRLQVTQALAQVGSSNTQLVGTCAPNTVVVRNIEPRPIRPFTSSDIIWLGRTIWESQDKEPPSHYRDVVFDVNFVEHKETGLVMTEDQYKWVQFRIGEFDWTFQQRRELEEFKKSVEYNAFFSERAFDPNWGGRPKRHLRGLIHTIQTNVTVYDPFSVQDFEAFFSNFLYSQAFRYNPNGPKKVAFCGARFLYNFNMAFNQYRRETSLETKKKIGIDIETYVLPGGFELKLIRNDVFRQGTPLEHWCVVCDPLEAEWRIVKDYTSHMVNDPRKRDVELIIEWQGTIAWHREESHALLRTP
ncbi:MAG: hypothetical protein QXO86_01300 [Nitrososphaerota archaeon]